MKSHDLFAGCSVTISPHEDVWLVSVHTDSLKTVSMRTYHELLEAIEAVHEWALMLSDETEIVPDAMDAFQILMETLARNALGEEIGMPTSLAETVERDELRAWYEREMG